MYLGVIYLMYFLNFTRNIQFNVKIPTRIDFLERSVALN